MYLTRTPLRVTLGGGGSDLPDNPDGFCVTATINRYVHVMVSRPFTDEIIVHHHQGTERVASPDQLQHRLLREILRGSGPIELAGISQIPAGTGLGSSSAFTVGALHAIHAYRNKYRSHTELADEACAIEVDRLGDPIGYQDQYACALGGLRWMRFESGKVVTSEIPTDPKTWAGLSSRLRLFYTGIERSAAEQMGRMGGKVPLDVLYAQGKEACDALYRGDLDRFAKGLRDQWTHKYDAAPTITHGRVAEWLNQAKDAGAAGGKLVGAGNGGFLLVYAHPDLDLTGMGLREIPITLTKSGTERL